MIRWSASNHWAPRLPACEGLAQRSTAGPSDHRGLRSAIMCTAGHLSCLADAGYSQNSSTTLHHDRYSSAAVFPWPLWRTVAGASFLRQTRALGTTGQMPAQGYKGSHSSRDSGSLVLRPCDAALLTRLVFQLRDSPGLASCQRLSRNGLPLPASKWLGSTDLVEVLSCRPHLLPGLVQQLDTDSKELFKGSVMGEKHWVVVIAPFICCRGETESVKALPSGTQGTHLATLNYLHSSPKDKQNKTKQQTTDHSHQGA